MLVTCDLCDGIECAIVRICDVMSAGEFRISLGEHHTVVLKEDGSVWSTPVKLRGLVSANRLFFRRPWPGRTSKPSWTAVHAV